MAYSIVLVALGLALLVAGYLVGKLVARIEALEAERDGKRHTHSTTAGLEDTLAAIARARITMNELSEWLDYAGRIAGETREGPNAYDKERTSEDGRWKMNVSESGHRITIKKK